MDQSKIDALFEQIWSRFNSNKPRLRSLSEKDRDELKSVMKHVFMAALSAQAIPQEIKLDLSGFSETPDVADTVRKVLKEELSGLVDKLSSISVAPAINTDSKQKEAQIAADSIILNEAMFVGAESNIDDVKIEGTQVGGIAEKRKKLKELRDSFGKDKQGD